MWKISIIYRIFFYMFFSWCYHLHLAHGWDVISQNVSLNTELISIPSLSPIKNIYSMLQNKILRPIKYPQHQNRVLNEVSQVILWKSFRAYISLWPKDKSRENQAFGKRSMWGHIPLALQVIPSTQIPKGHSWQVCVIKLLPPAIAYLLTIIFPVWLITSREAMGTTCCLATCWLCCLPEELAAILSQRQELFQGRGLSQDSLGSHTLISGPCSITVLSTIQPLGCEELQQWQRLGLALVGFGDVFQHTLTFRNPTPSLLQTLWPSAEMMLSRLMNLWVFERKEFAQS